MEQMEETKIMKNVAAMTGVLALSLFGAGHAMAGVLLDLVNSPGQTNTPYTLNFTSTSVTSDVEFAGYQLPSSETAEDISLTDTTAGGPNILGQIWNFTPAASGTDTSQSNDGYGTGTNGLDFAGVTLGDFDTYDQDVTTVVGDQYALAFLFTQSPDNEPSEFTVSASNASTASTATPEPATLFLFGAGLLGVAIAARKRRKA